MKNNQQKRFIRYRIMKKYPDFFTFIKTELQKKILKRIDQENSNLLLTGTPTLQGICKQP